MNTHTTYRELLELAAKAAGTGIQWGCFGFKQEWLTEDTVLGGMRPWRPLTDDGDALRLAVQLGIDIQVIHPRDSMELGRSRAGKKWCLHNGDPCAATRRAVVHAAAELGRQMQEKDI